MRRCISLFSCLALPALIVLVGCQNSTSTPPASAPTSAEVTSESPAPAAAPKSDEERIAAEMAKLSEEDRKLAMHQKVCPVSDQPLGSMEGMTKVHVSGRDVFICCEGCEEFLKEEPEKYLAKLPPPPAN